MKKKLFVVLAISLLIFGIGGMAQATVIVDTGNSYAGQNWSLSSYQWLAAEFSTSQDFTITDVEGYLNTSIDGTLTVAIYAGGTEIPTGTALYSSQFIGQNGWAGAFNQSWFLPAGTYWAAFEVRSGDTYSGAFPGSATTQLGNEAFTSGGIWSQADDLALTIRILGDDGNVVPGVPEPTTMLLLGLGLLGLAGVRRKIKK